MTRIPPCCHASKPRLVGCVAVLTMLAGAPARAVTHLHRGDKPPPIELNSLEGKPFRLIEQQGHPVILIFGELYHEKSLAACRAIVEILSDPRVAETKPVCELVVAQQADPSRLRQAAAEQRVGLPVLHDRDRIASAAYEVSVLPSVVVIDGKGQVVHAMAGLSAAFRDTLLDATLVAAGRLSGDQLSRTIHPTSSPAESSDSRRAIRLSELARQLARGGMLDLAAEKYREALQVDPRCLQALVGLGRTEVQLRQLPEAEKRFREALAASPNSSEAKLGIGYVLMLRGGGELPVAEKHIRSALAERPNDPEAHYLLGLILEQSGKGKDAMASYRKAAELLLERGG